MSDRIDMPLKDRIHATLGQALAQGAILPLQTESENVTERGLSYVVSWVSSLSLKDMATLLQKAKPLGSNPFLPYEEALFVENLSSTHLALLNKFPMEYGHVMAVTRTHVPQLATFGPADFHALAALLLEVGGYAMYNGGRAAGASQNHRHFHVLPQGQLPFEALFPQEAAPGQITPVAFFPFVHAFLCLHPQTNDVAALALQLQQVFDAAWRHCGMAVNEGEMPPFSLLATRRWLLLVPRRQECWTEGEKSISINALHYGGLIGVREPGLMDAVKRVGLMTLLAAVSYPPTP
jgi:ATP adenylyltransferase